jgi:hypothetical protein
MGGKNSSIENFYSKTFWRRLGKLNSRLEKNIKMDHKEMSCEDTSAQD